jgi:hypothetical protein
MSEVRPDVLAQVAYELHEIAARAVEEQSRVVEQLNPAELAVVLGTREVAARSMAEQEGVLPDQPSIFDATNRQLFAVATVWAVLSRWDCSLDLDKRLGDELKVLPASEVKVIHEVLQSAGLL